MVEINGEQCRDRKESNQVRSTTTNSLEMSLILNFEEGMRQARQRITSHAKSTVFYAESSKMNESSARTSRQTR